jgi:hypothetical protein
VTEFALVAVPTPLSLHHVPETESLVDASSGREQT